MKQLQIINQDQKFNPAFNSKLISGSFNNSNKGEYLVLAIIGSQSSGKSSLLNEAFGTNFEIMQLDSRKKTTQGIWISKAENLPLLILDVEGTDGRERGDDLQFERKSALFSLAVSQILIINIWENCIGLHSGGNLVLLRTILEVDLQLFAKSSAKKKVIFMIRDYLGKTPIENHENIIKNGLESIWDEIKPKDGSIKLDDLIEVEVLALPNKETQYTKFKESLKDIVKILSSKEIHDKYSEKNNITIDMLPRYFESIWNTIKNNKDLDIPKQQILQAKYRCEEIANEIIVFKRKEVKEKNNELGNIETFKIFAEKIIETGKEEYKNRTNLYPDLISEAWNEILKKEILETLYPHYENHKNKIKKELENQFERFLNELAREKDCMFTSISAKKSDEYRSDLIKKVKEIIPNGIEWDYSDSLNNFEQIISKLIEKIGEAIVLKESNQTFEIFRKTITKRIPRILNLSNDDIWENVTLEYNTAFENVTENIAKISSRFELNQDVSLLMLDKAKEKCWIIFNELLKAEFSDTSILMRIKEKFLRAFRYQKTGIPRVWQNLEQLEATFTKSLIEARRYLELLSKYNNDNNEIELITSTSIQSIYTEFTKEADTIFVDAKRALIASQKYIPGWIIILLIILGWNEISFLLSSPVYLMMVFFLFLAYYSLSAFNMLPPIITFIQKHFSLITEKIENLTNQATPFKKEE